MPRILFIGAINQALQDALKDAGVDSRYPKHLDWYVAANNGTSPLDFAERIVTEVEENKPDAVVLPKGLTHIDGHPWFIPPSTFYWLKQRNIKLVFACHDDPAATPIIVNSGITKYFDLWLTSCPGIKDIWKQKIIPEVKEWWLAWDHRIRLPIIPEKQFEVDLAITGTPYFKPFPKPHYQRGWSGTPRREYAKAAIKAGYNVGIWGPETWLDENQGGDPELKPFFRGWLSPTRIHVLHASASVCLATHLVSAWRYDSGRLPWICGAGGTALHERRPGLVEEFGKNIAWFEPGSIPDFLKRLRWLLRHQGRRLEMSASAQRIVLARHTWRHRAEFLVREIERLING